MMRGLIALVVMSAFVIQDPSRSITATAAGMRVTVRWTAPADRPVGEWIGIYRVGAPVEPFPPAALWRNLPVGDFGEMEFEVPESGEWEARYLSGSNAALASAKVMVLATARSRLRKLSYYENGILLWESETMDDTEASRHLSNVSLSERKGVEARIEVRYATVTYPAQPDEVGTWRK